ncbi:hypothetical protein ACFQ07_22745 [Actinomadura adrarensis]|uniref:Bacterial bifunctional deaminase-reductase C-terminal domain-containing protein n=1 Tax=Actinomadura adrarensis TaxID=1819600 RepID=A0ABW3CN92_9ACTN
MPGHFSQIWPGRDDPFAVRMNAMPMLVASRTLTDTSAWANSTLIDGDLIDALKRRRHDVIVTGSLSVVHPPAAALPRAAELVSLAAPGAGRLGYFLLKVLFAQR